jgi:hypothetical protein
MAAEDPTAARDLAPTFARTVAAAFGTATRLTATTALAGDASSRRYFRLALAGADGVPATVVAMVLGADTLPLSSAELTVFATPPTELPYVNVGRFLARIGVRIPVLHCHDQAAGVLLLEDAGDRTLFAAAAADGGAAAVALYGAAIDALVQMQIIGTAAADPACVAFQQRFDRRLFVWEYEHFLEYGLAPNWSGDVARLRALFAPVVDRLATAPAVLAHRDFHGWNLHVHEGAIRVLDFQDALLAPATYDLASLLTDRDTATVITPAREEQLVTHFVDARRAAGGGPEDAAALRGQYHLCVLQRALKVIGRFRYLANVKGKPGYQRFLPHVAAQARRALAAEPMMLADLNDALAPHLAAACGP